MELSYINEIKVDTIIRESCIEFAEWLAVNRVTVGNIFQLWKLPLRDPHKEYETYELYEIFKKERIHVD